MSLPRSARSKILFATFTLLVILSFACDTNELFDFAGNIPAMTESAAKAGLTRIANQFATQQAKDTQSASARMTLTGPPTATRTPTPTSSPTPSRTPTLQPMAVIRDGAERVQILDSDGKPTGQTAENHPADISDVQVTWLIDSSLFVCVNRFKKETSFSSAVNLFLLPASGTRPLAFFSWQLHADKLTTEAEDAKGPLPTDKWSIEFDKDAVARVCFKIASSIADQAKRIEVNSFDRPKETDLRGFDMAGPFPLPPR